MADGLHPADLQAVPHPHGRRHPDHRPPHRLQPAAHRRRPGHPAIPPATTASSPDAAGPPGRWPAPWPASLLAASPPTSPSPWPATTPSMSTAARRSTARAATATRSAPPTATPPGAGGTSGSSWPSWSGSPSPSRPWALPVLVALYRTPEWDREHGRRHKTPCELAAAAAGRADPLVPRPPVRLRRRRRLRHARAGPLRPPPPPPADPGQPVLPRRQAVRARPGGRRQAAGHGPARRGRSCRRPQEVVATTRPDGPGRLLVRRRPPRRRGGLAARATGYKSGKGLVPVRWVFVHDLTGTHRDEYFFSTDVAMAPR